MAHSDAACENDLYYCYSLSSAAERDKADIAQFEAIDENGINLAWHLKARAAYDESHGLMRTYLVRDQSTDELVGYFSLKAGLVSTGESGDDMSADFDTMPGIELANFAVTRQYRDAHPESKGCGRIIFTDFVGQLVESVARVVGVFTLYIFSLPLERLMRNYESYGFVRLPREEETLLHARLKPRYDSHCVFMYMTI